MPNIPNAVRKKDDGSGVELLPEDSASTSVIKVYGVLVCNIALPVRVLLYGAKVELLGPIERGLSRNRTEAPMSGKKRLKTISEVANCPYASVAIDWEPSNMALNVTLTLLGVGLLESLISKSPVPPKSPPKPPCPVDDAKEVTPTMLTPLPALDVNESDDAAAVALANAVTALTEVEKSLTWLNCELDPLRSS